MSTIKETYKEAEETAKVLNNIDFGKEDVNIEEYFTAIEKLNNRDKDKGLAQEEAENLIKNYSKFLPDDVFNGLESKRNKIYDLIRKYDPNSSVVSSFKEKDVNYVYSIGKFLYQEYMNSINTTHFNFQITPSEFKFLRKTLVDVIEYDTNSIYHYVELVDSFLTAANTKYEEEKKSELPITFNITINNILIIQELLKTFKVKGSSSDYRYFKNIILTINECIRLYNAFGIIAQRINEDFMLWGTALDSVVCPKVITEKEAEKEAENK